MAGFPTCSSPSNVQLTYPGPGSFNVQWNGDASTYKLAYRKETDSAWVIDSVSGPGSSGGSGANMDDTGGVITPTTPNASANFTVSSLTPAVYDLRLVNICQDGSSYVRKIKAIIEENVGSISNLRLATDPGNNFQVNIEWDLPTVDSGNPIIISWCKINRFGQKIDCTSDQVDHAVQRFSIFNPGSDITMIWVSQQAANGFQYSTSNPLFIEGIPCEDTGCRYQPYTPESENSI